MRQIYHIPRQIRQCIQYSIPQNILGNEEARRKIDQVSRAEKSRTEGVSFARSAYLMKVSRSSLYRWARYMQNGQWSKLISRSRTPRHARETTLPKETVDLFVEIRNAHPGLGGRKIAKIIRRDYGHEISFSQADRLVTKLLRNHIIVPARARYSTQNSGKTPRIRQDPPSKATKPGDIVQTDTLHLGKGIYLITVIDVVSRMIASGIFTACTAEAAKAALIRAQKVFPFSIRCVQTDGGSEFKGVCDAWIRANGMYHYTIPPRSPEINGCIERMQSVWRQEYWNCYTLPSYRIDDLRAVMRQWEYFYNYTRPHGALGYLTPAEGLTRIGRSP